MRQIIYVDKKIGLVIEKTTKNPNNIIINFGKMEVSLNNEKSNNFIWIDEFTSVIWGDKYNNITAQVHNGFHAKNLLDGENKLDKLKECLKGGNKEEIE